MTATPEPAAERLARFTPSALDERRRALYDAIIGGPRAQGPQAFALTDGGGALVGPFNAMLLNPALGQAVQALGTACRFGTALTDRSRELAILVVAHERRSTFEIEAHEAVGAQVGLLPSELELLRTGSVDHLADPTGRLVVVTTRALAARGDLDDAEYAAAVDGLGAEGVFELTTIVGYYSMLALQLRVFRV